MWGDSCKTVRSLRIPATDSLETAESAAVFLESLRKRYVGVENLGDSRAEALHELLVDRAVVVKRLAGILQRGQPRSGESAEGIDLRPDGSVISCLLRIGVAVEQQLEYGLAAVFSSPDRKVRPYL